MKTMTRALAICGTLIAPPLLMTTALAHHSTAQFDFSKHVKFEGTIKKFSYQNPHAWIWLEVPQADGSSKEVGIECGSPSMLRSNGLAWNALKKGEKVTVDAAPFRDTEMNGGALIKITWPDGHSWAGPLPAPPGAATAPPP